jgi:hypothetical protein
MTERFNTADVTPADLVGLSVTLFRAVVDADLRRRVRPAGLSEATSRALRSADHVERWHATLASIQHSVQGQITATADEYEAARLAIEGDIKALEGDAGNAGRISRLYDEARSLRSEYMSKKASRERFLTGLKEYLVEAESLRDQQRTSVYESSVVDERDLLLDRVAVLEQAIGTHRSVIMSDLDENEDPVETDLALWRILQVNDG